MSNASHLILLVDDEPMNLLLLEELLESEGYQTRSATSGSEALEMSAEQVPDLILLDVMMPDMDGFDVCTKLRENPELQTVPIIFVTALDDDESRIQGLESLADDYLTKPIQANLLFAKISSLLRLKMLRSKEQKNNDELEATPKLNESLIEKLRLFVPEQFLCRIAPKGVNSIQLGNRLEETLTILFCDIRGFTTLAESQNPTETYEWLNAFFTHMSDAISANYGFIDKYLGDAIMAVFDRPGVHGLDGMNAAVAMVESLQKFNTHCHKFKLEAPIRIGIGVHTGKAAIGTIGSNSRMDSTVIGDAVNTASRLEELTKTYGCQVIVSEATIDRLAESDSISDSISDKISDSISDSIYVRSLARLVLRGKKKSIKIYELIGNDRIILEPTKLNTKSLFERGIHFWFEQNFQASLSSFEEVLQQDSDDTVAAFYVQRCREQLNH